MKRMQRGFVLKWRTPAWEWTSNNSAPSLGMTVRSQLQGQAVKPGQVLDCGCAKIWYGGTVGSFKFDRRLAKGVLPDLLSQQLKLAESRPEGNLP